MDDPVPSTGPHHGRVAAFDPARGLGEVLDDEGTTFAFHATAIADGSRAISAGTPVAFTVAPGHGGRYQARALTPLPEAQRPDP